MAKKISIVLPKSWQELTDRQLYYIYNLFADNLSSEQIKTYCLMKWGKLQVVCRYGNGYLLKRDKVKFVVTAELLADALAGNQRVGVLIGNLLARIVQHGFRQLNLHPAGGDHAMGVRP